MQLVPYRPQALRSIFGMGRDFERVLDDVFDNAVRRAEPGYGEWVPPVDLHSTDESVELWTDLPGMTKNDIDLRIEGNQLTIRGERKLPAEQTNWLGRERAFGTFERTFTLPTELDASKAEAVYRDGVLHVVIPKMEEAKPRRLQIRVG